MATRDSEEQRPVLKLAEEEARFGRVSIPRRCWAPPGIRPRAPRQMIREYTDVSAAVAPAQGKMTALGLPGTTTAMMQRLLLPVRQTFQEEWSVMHVERAGWHQAKDLVVPEQIRLMAQPASSPAVTPVEQHWRGRAGTAVTHCGARHAR